MLTNYYFQEIKQAVIMKQYKNKLHNTYWNWEFVVLEILKMAEM